MIRFILILFLCVACEQPESSSLKSNNTCSDFGQMGETFTGDGQEVTFFNDCSASFKNGCETVFTYSSFENETNEENRVMGDMPVQILSGNDWPGCPQVSDNECFVNYQYAEGFGKTLLLKCEEDRAGFFMTNVVPDE